MIGEAIVIAVAAFLVGFLVGAVQGWRQSKRLADRQWVGALIVCKFPDRARALIFQGLNAIRKDNAL